MKSKILSIFILAIISLPVYVQAETDIAPVEPAPVVNTVDEESIEPAENTAEPDISVEAPSTLPYKEPVSKRKIVKKFLAAMAAVALSSFIIYFLLTIYNRIREGSLVSLKPSEGETSLETPDDLNSAVKTFLDKTDWRG